MSRSVLVFVALATISTVAVVVSGSAAPTPADAEAAREPRWVAGSELVRPEGYRSWVFVGASIGLSYSDRARTDGPGQFHHVYINPEAYAHFSATGKFPEKTVLVMEVYKPEQKVSINKQGYFEGERVALEVAVKDRERLEDGWAYFDFANGAKASARPFPRATCHQCHLEHGATDNVFTQFYPVLRPAPSGGAKEPLR